MSDAAISAGTPTAEAELAALIREANGPLRICGGATRPGGRPSDGSVLSTASLSGIHLYEPGALALVAGAGTPVAEIDAALAEEGQRLPFEPMDHRTLLGTEGDPTLGGMVATNASGPARVQAGACRDSLIGVRFVDGSGTVISNGGRVMKNVTGYDLVKLMAGSHGTLGVLTEVSFKLLPRPEARGMLVAEGLDDATALAAMTSALSTPFEVTGAAHVQGNGATPSRTYMRIEGFTDSVTTRTARLREHLYPQAAFEVVDDQDAIAETWVAIRDVHALAGQPGDVWRLSLRPTSAAKVVARLPQARVQYDWGGARVWALVPEGTDLRAELGEIEGYATLVRASEATRREISPFPPESAGVAKLSDGLRRRFDPRGILNPGLMT